MPEVSRQLIRAQVELETKCVPWEDLNCFGDLALDKMVTDYKSVGDEGKITFFDRGIPDVIAYLKVGGLSVNERFFDAASKFRYAKEVFMAPPWAEIYVNDAERWQTFEEACVLHDALFSVYKALEYNIQMLPYVSVEERVDFVVEKINAP